jgi:hypothetical protein
MLQQTEYSQVSLDALGDQSRLSESKHARRARFHQSWYRAGRLGIKGWGLTTAGTPLGSILPEPAASLGKNFTSLQSKALFLKRRTQGWGVDPIRTTRYMTSSQTLLVNLLGPLAAEWGWLLDVLRVALERPDFTLLRCVEVEFAPSARKKYLGDMTRVDAFFIVETLSGAEGIVLELKYTDRFSSRKLPLADSPAYLALAKSTAVWRDSSEALSDDSVSQLLRCHALGLRTLEVECGSTLPVTLVLVSHPLDEGAGIVFDAYSHHLADRTQARHITLDRFLAAAAATTKKRLSAAAVRELELRYLAHGESDELWQEHLAVRQVTMRR